MTLNGDMFNISSFIEEENRDVRNMGLNDPSCKKQMHIALTGKKRKQKVTPKINVRTAVAENQYRMEMKIISCEQ